MPDTRHTPTLVEWLTARLDEDEAVARELAAWGGDLGWDISRAISDTADEERNYGGRFNPARVLADVAAKKAIVRAEAEPYVVGHVPATLTLRALASVYRDAPGYRTEWDS